MFFTNFDAPLSLTLGLKQFCHLFRWTLISLGKNLAQEPKQRNENVFF